VDSTAVRKIAVPCLLGLLFCAASLSAQDSQAFYISFQVPGSTATSANAINDFFTVTGTYTDAKGTHGYLRDVFGKITCFDVPWGGNTSPAAINDDGMIVGTYTDSSSVVHGFLRRPDGHFTSIDPAGSTGTYLTGISAFGDISGFAFTSALNVGSECFVRSPQGTITVFGLTHCKAQSINVYGAITGFSAPVLNVPGPPPAILVISFVRSPEGVITYFNHPGTSANGCFSLFIDASGETAGFFQNSQDLSQNFLGPTSSITPPGSSSTETFISALSQLGAAAGTYSLLNHGGSYAFVQNPQGVLTSFTFPGGGTNPSGINDFGVVIGTSNGFGVLRIPY
jgi:hypothetical protein